MRTKHLFLLGVALLTTLTTRALTFQSGDLYYKTTSTTTVEVTYQTAYYWDGTNYQGLTTAIIPETVTYSGTTYSVTSIREWAFAGSSSLTSVTIPNSVTSIGDGAFFECSSLTSVTIPNSVTSIGKSAFWYCSSLTPFLTIPKSVTVIKESAFYKVPIVVYNGSASGSPWGANKYINGYADGYLVYDSEGKKEIIYCSPLASGEITLPNSVTRIGDNAFYNCKALTSICIPNSVTSIGNSVFSGCSSLTSVTIPNSVTNIGDDAFYLCSSLTSVTIPNSVTNIGDDAFCLCSSLTSVTIPNSVTSIGKSAFCLCSSLTSVTIPNSVTSIGSSAFRDCSSLTSITLPNSVTSIGDCAFFDCSSLTTVTIPNSVTSIREWAFSDCSSLTSITIPNSVTNIGERAFSNCSSLTSITIPNSVTSIGNDAFQYCSALNAITWNARNCETWIRANYSPFYDIRSNITSFIIGEEVDTIPSYLCSGMDSLTSIIIPKNVKHIGGYTFEDCTNLSSVAINSPTIVSNAKLSNIFGKKVESYILGDSITVIGQYAFKNCSALKSITIPDNVTTIGEGAFQNCSTLTTITIPENVEMMEKSVFSGCTNIKSVIWNAKICNHNWNVNTVTPFYDIRKQITSFTFGEKVDSIPFGLCAGMVNLSSMTIGDNITGIAPWAFADSGLKTVTIGRGIKSVTGLIFENCSRLDSIFCRALEPPTDYGNNAFIGVPTKVTVVVPCESYDSYRMSIPWCRFENIKGTFPPSVNVLPIDETMGSVSISKKTTCHDSTIIFSAIPKVGYRFKQWTDSCTDNPRTVFVTHDTTFVAEFDVQTYTIELVCDSTHGVVQGSGIYQEGKEINICAIANEPYRFKYWSDGNTENPRSIRLFQDTTIGAIFDNNYLITTNYDEDKGVVTGGGEYPYGTKVVITAVANEPYRFKYWSDGNTENPHTVMLLQDITITAIFDDNYLITINYDENKGTVIGGGEYPYGTKVELTAIANEGYEFDCWNNNTNENPYTIVLMEDTTIEAYFKKSTNIKEAAIDNTVQVYKICKNGQVLILRNGVTYDMMGNTIDSHK